MQFVKCSACEGANWSVLLQPMNINNHMSMCMLESSCPFINLSFLFVLFLRTAIVCVADL